MNPLAALDAVLAPSDTPYLTSCRHDGSHAFSASLADHNRAVQQYQKSAANGGGPAARALESAQIARTKYVPAASRDARCAVCGYGAQRVKTSAPFPGSDHRFSATNRVAATAFRRRSGRIVDALDAPTDARAPCRDDVDASCVAKDGPHTLEKGDHS
jgi:hypothetical protein